VRAAALVYFGAQIAVAVAGLDLEFRTMLNEVNRLDPSWSQQERDMLADRVQTLAIKESRLNQLQMATSSLQSAFNSPAVLGTIRVPAESSA
jgi:hypothetical protein